MEDAAPDKKQSPALKAIFSTANLNGTAAILLSLSMGTLFGTALYAYAVAAGTYNKYQSLKNPDAVKKGFLTRTFTDPSITARILMLAAVYNFGDAGLDVLDPEMKSEQIANGLRMAGWSFGFLGDNALRRLDSVNFKKGKSLTNPNHSKLRETFNALVSNPTIFYNGASMAFSFSELSTKKMDLFTTWQGGLGIAAMTLISIGLIYAARKTWKANKGDISTAEINDGIMNYCSSGAKFLHGVIGAVTGNISLAIAQSIFMLSNIKLIFETREALGKKRAPEPPPSPDR